MLKLAKLRKTFYLNIKCCRFTHDNNFDVAYFFLHFILLVIHILSSPTSFPKLSELSTNFSQVHISYHLLL